MAFVSNWIHPSQPDYDTTLPVRLAVAYGYRELSPRQRGGEGDNQMLQGHKLLDSAGGLADQARCARPSSRQSNGDDDHAAKSTAVAMEDNQERHTGEASEDAVMVGPALETTTNGQLNVLTKIESESDVELVDGQTETVVETMDSPSPAAVHIFTDASVRAGRGGIGIFYGDQDPRNVSESVQCNSSFTLEFFAVYQALERSAQELNLVILSDCLEVSKTFSSHLTPGRKPRKAELQRIIEDSRAIIQARTRSGLRTEVRYVQGHNGNPGNVAADRLAGEASRKSTAQKADHRYALRSHSRRHRISLDQCTSILEGGDISMTDSQSLPVTTEIDGPADDEPVGVPSESVCQGDGEEELDSRSNDMKLFMQEVKRRHTELLNIVEVARVTAEDLECKKNELSRMIAEAMSIVQNSQTIYMADDAGGTSTNAVLEMERGRLAQPAVGTIVVLWGLATISCVGWSWIRGRLRP